MRDVGRTGLPIVYTGLRPGERLHEHSPVTPDMTATTHPKIFHRHVGAGEAGDIGLLIRALQEAISTYDDQAVRRLVEQWVRGGKSSGASFRN